MSRFSLLAAVAFAAVVLIGSVNSHKLLTRRDPVISCDRADFLFVLNVQRYQFSSRADYRQLIDRLLSRGLSLIDSGISVGVVLYSKKIEHTVPISMNRQNFQAALQRLEFRLPRGNGIATGKALVVAKKLWIKFHQLAGDRRRSLTVVGVAGDTNFGLKTAGPAVELRQKSTHVVAVTWTQETSQRELYRISSTGTSGIFRVTSPLAMLESLAKFAKLYCPCPIGWEVRQNCTDQGQTTVERFRYERSEVAPFNCVRTMTSSVESCPCPPDRTETSACVNNTITITTYSYSRADNDSVCVASVSNSTEPCGRSVNCESITCPPGSTCIDNNGNITCQCVNSTDVYDDAGCQPCGNLEPRTTRGPCLNGHRAVETIQFVRETDRICRINAVQTVEACEMCNVNETTRVGPCVRGYSQLTRIVYVLGNNGNCYKVLRQSRRACRPTVESQCVGSVNPGGQFVTFDGQLVDFPGPCSYILTRKSAEFTVTIEFSTKFPSLPFLTNIESVRIAVGTSSFQLTNRLRLITTSGVEALPYRDTTTGAEGFFVDGALVFTVGNLYLQYRGESLTVRILNDRTGLTGILGNCNGDVSDDYTDANGNDVSSSADRNTRLGTSFQVTNCVTTPCCPVPTRRTCSFNISASAEELTNCGLLGAGEASPFRHCGAARLRPLLDVCRNLYCRAVGNPSWQRALVCSVMETAAFRCFLNVRSSGNNSYPIYRAPEFCPKQCHRNAEFVNNASYCPRTCERHFFNSDLGCVTPFGPNSANLLGQTPIPGCQCKEGFVLDGSRCVRPNECECLSNLCIDRESRALCEQWKSEGRCEEHPLLMRKFCRLTCQQCQATCQNQISTTTCVRIKNEGRCSNTFYQQMCQLTCNPQGCECPECKIVRSPCDPDTLNRNVTRFCFNPDPTTGQCRMEQVSKEFEECGICQTDRSSVVTRSCDYCNETQVTTRSVFVRENSGERRCVRVERTDSTRSPGCSCSSTVEREVCYRNSEIYRVVSTRRPTSDCTTCESNEQQIRVRNVTCPSSVMRGNCDTEVSRRMTITINKGVVRNCQCDTVVIRKEVMCACPAPRVSTPICFRNEAWIRWRVSYRLNKGVCQVSSRRIPVNVPCQRRMRRNQVCQGRKRVLKMEWYDRERCRCVRRKKEKVIGLCACPKPRIVRGSCINGVREKTVTRYSLEDYQCTRFTQSLTVRCSCPPAQKVDQCDGETGERRVGEVRYELDGETCRTIRNVRTEPTNCQATRVVERSSCQLLDPEDTIKYRKVTYEAQERIDGSCQCRRSQYTKSEPCGCRERLVDETHCPADCPLTSRQCPRKCKRHRIQYRLRYFNGRCKREQINKETFPCCCNVPRPKPPKCVENQFLLKQRARVHLVHNACVTRHQRIKVDMRKTCDLSDSRVKRSGDLIIEQRRKIVRCRCVWRSRSRRCPRHCGKAKVFTRCDPASNEKMHVRISQERVGCRCQSKRQLRRQPVTCPEAKLRRRYFCRRRGYLLLEKTTFHPENCACRSQVWRKHLPCSHRCNPNPKTTVKCDPSGTQAFRLVVHNVPRNGRCVRSFRRFKIRMPTCRSSKAIRRKCVNGKLVIMKNVAQLQRCRCRSRTVRKIVGRCGGDLCAKRNSLSRRQRVKRSCNRQTNELSVYKLWWVENENGECVQKWKRFSRRVEPQCPAPKMHRRPCNSETGTQTIEIRRYQMQNCRCNGPRVIVKHQRCSCKKAKLIRRLCDHRSGSLVSMFHVFKWNSELESCHAKRMIKKVPIPCGHRNAEQHSSCRNGKMTFTRIKFRRNPRTCRCRQQKIVSKIDCRCRVKVVREPCRQGVAIAHTIFLYRKFNPEKRRCIIVRRRRRYRRCSCPKPKKTTSCENGRKVVKTVRHRIENGRCEKSNSEESFAVSCSKEPVVRTSGCGENCESTRSEHRYQVNPDTCRCELRQISQQRCKCCGCPKSGMERQCVNNRHWKTSISYYSIRTKTCSNSCKRQVKIKTEAVRCSERRSTHWSRCNSNCRSFKYVVSYRPVRCRCVKREQRLQLSRACCCPRRVDVRNRCDQRSGRWMTITTRSVLEHYRCRRRTDTRLAQVRACQISDTPLSYGACNTNTCQQQITRTVSRLNKRTCECHLVKVPAGQRTCCCKGEPQVTTACINNNQIQRTVVSIVFNSVTYTCETNTQVSVVTVECPDTTVRVTNPPCTSATRTLVSTRATVQNCQCVNETISTRTEACFCPSATEWRFTRCDNQQRVFTRTTYQLVSGQCISSTEEQRRPVTIEGPVTTRSCDNSSCTETITTVTQSVDAITCVIQSRTNIATGICCCPTAVTTTRTCINNELIDVTSRKEFVEATRTCETRTQETRSTETVPCEPETRQDLGCNRATRYRSIRVVTRSLVNCNCQVSSRTTLRQICACPPDRTTQSTCNRRTCMRTITRVHFVSTTLANGTVSCTPERNHEYQRCCCNREGEPKVKVVRSCDQQSGNFVITKMWRKFIGVTRTCRVARHATVNKVRCGGPDDDEHDRDTRRGDCDLETGKQQIVTIWYEKIRSECRCERRIRVTHRQCSCKHLRSRVRRSCDEESNEIVRMKKFFVLRNNRCELETRTKREVVPCPEQRTVKNHCGQDCRHRRVITYHKLDNCQCRRQQSVERSLCCCPEPKYDKTCDGERWRILTIRYQLSNDRKTCTKDENNRYARIECSQQASVKRSGCNRATCNRISKVIKLRVSNCKCVPYIAATRKQRCCCPQPKRRVHCGRNGRAKIMKIVRFRLIDGQCVAKVTEQVRKIRCHKPKMIDRTGCNQETGLRKFKLQFFRLKGCQCVPKFAIRTQLCSCPQPKIVKQRCHKDRPYRVVFQISYRMPADRSQTHCVPERRVLYKEPCSCPPPKRRRECDKDQGDTILYKSLSFHLSRRRGRRTCVRSQKVQKNQLHCKSKRMTRGRCFRGIRKFFITYYVLRSCRCVQRKRVVRKRCEMPKPRKVKKCLKNKGIILIIISFVDPNTGVWRSQKRTRKVRCESEKVVQLSRGCSIQKRGSLYQKIAVIQEYRRGCQCYHRRQIHLRLCRCRRPIHSKKCLGDTVEFRYTVMFKPKNGHCVPMKRKKTVMRKCRGRRVLVKKGDCNRRTCKRRVFAVIHRQSRCHCESSKKVGEELCCTPRPAEQRICRNGLRLIVTRFYLLKKIRLLAKDTETGVTWFQFASRRRVRRRKEAINCPRPQVKQHCDRSTGVLTKRVTVHKIVQCRCIARMKTLRLRCRCPEPQIRVSRCRQGIRRVNKVFYELDSNGHCQRRSKTYRKKCACPPAKRFVKCLGGRRKICTTHYNLQDHCRPARRCGWQTVRCRAPKIVRSRCSRETGHRKLVRISFSPDQNTCQCEKETQVRVVDCDCSHKNYKKSFCENGVIKTVKKTFSLEEGRCVPSQSVSQKKVVCPESKWQVEENSCVLTKGVANSGTQLMRKVHYKINNCKCVKKTVKKRVPCRCSLIPSYRSQIFTQCVSDDTVRLTKINYHLEGHKCKKTAQTKTKYIECQEREKRRNKGCHRRVVGDSFREIVTYRLVAKDCKCKWIQAGTERVNCGCRQPKVQQRCVNNNMIETRKISYRRPDFESGNCVPQPSLRLTPVNCKPTSTRVTPCSNSSSYSKTITTRFETIDCHCKPRISVEKQRCSCPESRTGEEVCNPETNRFETRTIKYELENGQCREMTTVSERSVPCDTRSQNSTGACEQNRRTRTVTTRSLANCRCEVTTRSTTEICDCSGQRIEIGVCNGTQNFTYDRYYREIFNASSNSCSEVLDNQVVRYCQCGEARVAAQLCVNDTVIRRITVVPTLINNTCVDVTRTDEQTIACSVNQTRSSGTTRGECDGTTFTRTVTVVNFVMQNCACTPQTRRSNEICNCFERNGGRKERNYCVNNTVSVREVSYYYDSRNGECARRNFTIEDRITCVGDRRVRDKCNPDTGKVEIQVFQRRAESCACKWVQMPSVYEDCKCAPPGVRNVCRNGRKLAVTYYFEIINGRCVRKEKKEVRALKCKTNRKEYFGECSPFSNTRVHIKYVARQRNCRCSVQQLRNRCPCRCPSREMWSVCKNNRIVTYSHQYKLQGCKCVKHSSVKETVPICDGRRISRSTCLSDSSGDSFLTVVQVKDVAEGCRCTTVKRESKEACACAPRQTQSRSCDQRVLTIRTYRRLLINGQCRNTLIKTNRRTTACPPGAIRASTRCLRGVRLVQRTVWELNNCQCVPTVRIERQRCRSDCDVPPRIRRKSKCDRSTCNQHFRYFYKNQRCQLSKISLTAKCCCPRLSSNEQRKCNGRAYEVTRKFNKLHKDVCLQSTVTYRKDIACNRRLSYKHSGNRMQKVWYDVRNCKCQRLTRNINAEIQQCRPPRVLKSCTEAPESRLVNTIIRFVKRGGSCLKVTEVDETPIECSADVVTRSDCFRSDERNGYARRVERIRYIKSDCRCHERRESTIEMCHCFQPSMSTACDRQRGVLKVTRRYFEEKADGTRCKALKKTKSVNVHCDGTWRHAANSAKPSRLNEFEDEDNFGGSQMVLERWVKDGCTCRRQIKQLNCHSSCPRSTKSRVCKPGNKLFLVYNRYHSSGSCQCQALISSRPIPLALPQPSIKYGKCNKFSCVQRVFGIHHYIDNCQVKATKKVSSQKCCCAPSRTRSECRGHNLQVKITTSERLDNGKCARSSSSQLKVINCRALIQEQPVGKCRGGKQEYRRIFERAENCNCVRQTGRLWRRCDFHACQPSTRRLQACINCKAKMTIVDFAYDRKLHKCQPKRRFKFINCCCGSTKVKRVCRNNRLILTTTKHQFSNRDFRCIPNETTEDITRSLLMRCRRRERTVVGGCMQNGYRIRTTMRATLVECQCRLIPTYTFERCRCPQPSSRSECIRNGTTLYTRTERQSLDQSVCISRIDESFKPTLCPTTTRSEGACDETTCLRNIVTVDHSIVNCTCQRNEVSRAEICCCPTATTEARTCRRSDNVEVVTQTRQEFDLSTRSCVTRAAVTTRSIVCDANRRRVTSACDIMRNNSLYQTITDSVSVVSGCECTRITNQSEVLCGCPTTEPQTICTEDNRIQVYQIVYRPNANNTVCEPHRVVVSERDIDCDLTPRAVTPNCTNGTRSVTGETRINVVTTWFERGANCTCARQTRVTPRICQCPPNPTPRTICKPITNERFQVSISYILTNDTEPQCRPATVKTRLGHVNCSVPLVQLGRCHNGLMKVKTTVHHPNHCRCVPKTYTHFQRCSEKHEICINKLPDAECTLLNNRYKFCRLDFSGTAQAVREIGRLCDKTCNRCDSCSALGGQWKFQYAGSSCILASRRYPNLHLRNAKGFAHCRKKCASDKSCWSFDFYLPSGACSLQGVDRQRLFDLLHPRRHVLGASPKDLNNMDAERCGLYEKFCSRRIETHLEEIQLGCPRRRIESHNSQCICKHVALALGTYKLCYRTVEVNYFQRNPRGRCMPRRARVRTTCHDTRQCRDQLSPTKCQAIDRLGGCSVSRQAQLCSRTCNLCQCSGREFVHYGRCSRSKQLNRIYQTKWLPEFGICQVLAHSERESCTNCPVGLRTKVSACSRGQRTIYKLKIRLSESGQCQRSVKRHTVACGTCYLGVRRALGACVSGKRSLKIFYTEFTKGKCVERQINDNFGCRGCPRTRVKTSACINGRRLRRVTYYVRAAHMNKCYMDYFDTEEICRPLCYNKVSNTECHYLKSIGQCSISAAARKVCPRSCSLC